MESEFQGEAPAGESAKVLPVCPGGKQKQADVEKEERNADLGQDEVAKYTGRKVLKRFGRKKFSGDITNYDPDYKWYKVIYEDGDEEDLTKAEVEEILLPQKGGDEDGRERDLKKTKTPLSGKRYREGSMARLWKSKKNLTVADLSKYRGNGFPRRGIVSEKLQRSGRYSHINPPIGYQTASKVIKDKKGRVKQGSLGSPWRCFSSNTSSPYKLKLLKEQRGEDEPSLQLDINGSYSPFKNEYKERRRSGTGITLQEGIQRYLQKLKDAQQKTIPRARRKTDGVSNVTPGSKHAEKQSTQRFRAAVNPFSEGLDDFDQRNRASNQPVLEGYDSPGVSLGAALVGRSIKKKFGAKLYRGKVTSYDNKTKFYKVIYEDGDEEDLEWSELEPLLVPKRKKNDPEKFLETTKDVAPTFSEGVEEASKCSKVKGRNLESIEQGANLIGRAVRKKFSGKFYIGKVVSYDKKLEYYKVRYEDGDQEDLEWNELEPNLVGMKMENAPAKSTSAKRTVSKSILDGDNLKRRKTRSTS